MRKGLVIWEKDNTEVEQSFVSIFREEMKFMDIELELFPLEKKDLGKQFGEIRKKEADFFFVFDMAGFEQTTLQEDPSYNIISTIQIHVLFSNDTKYRLYLHHDIALNLFLLIDNETLYRRYQREYNHLLNFDCLPKMNLKKHPTPEELDANKQILFSRMQQIITEVDDSAKLKEALQSQTYPES